MISEFTYNASAENSGYYACCQSDLYLCDRRDYVWTEVDAGLVNTKPSLNSVDINIEKIRCEDNGKRANFLGYGMAINPWLNDLCAPLYSDDKFR